MRILWIQRRAADGDGGDSIYDRKLQDALASSHTITPYALKRNSRFVQLSSAVLRAAPPEQYGFGDRNDLEAVRRLLAQDYDIVVFSHEHLDAFAAALRPHANIPFVSLRHNVTSDAMVSILKDRPLVGALYGAFARAQERKALSGGLYDAVAAITTRDRDLLGAISGRSDIGLVLPGAPTATPLSDTAMFRRDLVVSGTFDWFPKARDLRHFAREWVAAAPAGFTVHASPGVPKEIAQALDAGPEAALDFGAAIRIGVITDRFTAGHKLKTAAYLMQNCAVATFAPVIHDFAGFPHAQDWIIEVCAIEDLSRAAEKLHARPPEVLRGEISHLKGEIGTQLAWSTQADALSTLMERTQPRR